MCLRVREGEIEVEEKEYNIVLRSFAGVRKKQRKVIIKEMWSASE